MKKTFYSCLLILLFGGMGVAQTNTLCNFDFNGGTNFPISPVSTASNVTASLSGTQTDAAYGGTATGSGAFISNATAGNSVSMSNSSGTNSQYWTVTLGGGALSTYQSYKVYFQTQRSTTGAQTVTIAYSTNGSSYTALAQTASPADGSFVEATIDLSGVTALNGQSAVYLRFEASGASGTGTLRIDNLQIQASLTPQNIWQNSGSNIYYTAGNVGIGNSSPAYPLDVTGAARITGALTSGAHTVSSLTSSGNITTAGSLTVTGSSLFTGAIKNSSLAGTGSRVLLSDANGNISALTGGTTSQVLYGNGAWGALPTNVIQTSGSNAYFTGGNFGIGTSSPAYPLDVTGNARITGTLTAGGISSSSSNLAISTPATFANSVTLSSLANGHNQRLSINAGGNIVAGGASTTWDLLGDAGTVPGTGTNQNFLGTTDPQDLVIATNTTERMRITKNGLVGIATAYPNALLHVSTNASGTTPGLIIDQGPSSLEGPPEFNVNSDGSAAIYNLGIPGTNDPLSINLQNTDQRPGGPMNTSITNIFRIAPNGNVGIGSSGLSSYIYGNTPVNVSTYKALTVSGDASFANYNTGSGNHTDGFTGIEILGNNQVPTRRGISVDNDPTGDFNFFVNSNQSGGNAEFHFKNGGTPTPTELMTIHDNGVIAFPLLQSTTSTAGGLKTLLIDVNGQLVAGSSVSSPSSAGWQLGGNSNTGSAIFGTLTGDDVPLYANNKELIRLVGTGSAVGNIAVANNSQILLSGMDLNHGLGAYTTDGSHTQFATTDINGPVLYGYNGGALGSNQVQTGTTPPIQKIALQWDANGKVYIGGHPQTAAGHQGALLQVHGDVVVGTGSAANIYVTQLNWSDFVFDENYKLMPLNEVENFYKTNHHLPNVPTTKDIQEQGNNLGQTDAVLLQKVEENTLYIVELKKQLDAQQKLIEALSKKLADKK